MSIAGQVVFAARFPPVAGAAAFDTGGFCDRLPGYCSRKLGTAGAQFDAVSGVSPQDVNWPT
ncbi:hypothetical protein [Streptomyces sp. NPDC060022]|uniref:hypothetical protein n=1 Tax=Streptomyces sp. NPDC060022 TaxID=3347039 RepID=UPI0036AA18DC